MALQITNISPSVGLSSGLERIEITGTDFDVNAFPPPPSNGPIGALPPSLQVFIDGIEAEEVWVLSSTKIICTTPRYVGNPKLLLNGPVAVDVTVENKINPATFTASSAFSYQHPDVTEPMLHVLPRVIRALLLELHRQIPVRKVVTRVHTDFDSEIGDLVHYVELTDVPSLVVTGPKIKRSSGVYRKSNTEEEDSGTPPITGKARKRFIASDLSFEVRLVDNLQDRLSALVGLLTSFVDENGKLKVEKVTGDPTQGFYEFDMEWGSLPEVNVESNRDNMSDAVGTINLLGVSLDRIDGIKLRDIIQVSADGVTLVTQQFIP